MNLLYYPKFWQKKLSIFSLILLPFSLIYTILGYLRYYFTLEQKLPGKVISIGNITAGGTGKTQLVMLLAQELRQKAINFAIVSKGYKGSYTNPLIVSQDMDVSYVGDEALELCTYGTTIVAKKVTDSIPLLMDINPEIIIVDDGIQNSSFYKDYRIVMLDSNRWFGNFLPIPSGPIRMPYIMHKVDSIIVVCNRHEKKKPKLQVDTYYAYIEPISQVTLNKNNTYYAFAAIGDPERFFNSLSLDGFNLVKTRMFPDHHIYNEQDILDMLELAQASGANLITTQKDHVKLEKRYKDEIKCYRVKLSLEDKEKFLNSIYEKLSITH